MNHWLEHFFSNAKVQRQLFTTFLLILSLPVLTIGLFLIYNTQRNLKNNYLEQTQSENLRVKSIMFDVTTSIINVSEDFSTDRILEDLLTRQYPDSASLMKSFDSYKPIHNILAKDTSIASIHIYSDNHTIGNYGNVSLITEEIAAQDWYQRVSSTAGIFWVTKSRTDIFNNEYYELAMYRRIPLISINSFAILEITVSDNYLKNRIDNNTLKSIASVNQDSVFFSTERFLKGFPMPAAIDYSVPYYKFTGYINVDGQPYIGAASTLQPYKSDDNIYIVSFNEEALPYIHKITLTYTCIVLLAMLLPCLLLYFFTKYFSARVITLRSAMHQASSGDYNIIDSFQGKDELSETFRDLHLMIEEILKKDAQVYQSRIREQQIENKQQQIEFKMLASQINPHFLYNTLETIRMKAFTAGNKDVATAIKLLGKSLRYVLENTGTASTTLAKELAYIDTYLTIQKLRFEDRVNYSLDVQPGLELSQFQILPLLLQPIVENAISHGLEEVDANGRISIHIYTDSDEYLYIDISDNGAGMEESELHLLRSNIIDGSITRTHSIGLFNINQRITLCYGPKYGMEITSHKGKGTCIHLRLPLNKRMEEL